MPKRTVDSESAGREADVLVDPGHLLLRRDRCTRSGAGGDHQRHSHQQREGDQHAKSGVAKHPAQSSDSGDAHDHVSSMARQNDHLFAPRGATQQE